MKNKSMSKEEQAKSLIAMKRQPQLKDSIPSVSSKLANLLQPNHLISSIMKILLQLLIIKSNDFKRIQNFFGLVDGNLEWNGSSARRTCL